MLARHLQLIPIILGIQEAEIRRITVQSQPGQMVHKTLILKKKKKHNKKDWWSGSRCMQEKKNSRMLFQGAFQKL
jgi:hypothetical protein